MMSTQCGGEALNLTVANRVIIVDPCKFKSSPPTDSNSLSFGVIQITSRQTPYQVINASIAGWNRCLEVQAICRVARIGQLKNVHAVRLLADDTVDTRMFEMQEIKMKQVSTALEHFQEDKSFGSRALRRVLGFRFQRQGDDEDKNLFKDSDDVEDEEEYDDSVEYGEQDDEDQKD
jgi:hypothetical protein